MCITTLVTSGLGKLVKDLVLIFFSFFFLVTSSLELLLYILGAGLQSGTSCPQLHIPSLLFIIIIIITNLAYE